MVWDGGSKPLVVPTRWALLGVALGGAPVWPSSGGVGFTEKSVVRRPTCYLPLGQLGLTIYMGIRILHIIILSILSFFLEIMYGK